jgi:proline dehydrogenase
MNASPESINFNNTEKAFAYKNNLQLKKAHWLFQFMQFGWIVKLGSHMTPLLIKFKIPVKGLIKKTIFSQFVGGENLSETTPVVKMLHNHHVDVILDYGVEGGEYEDSKYDREVNEFIKVIEFAGKQPNAPFISIKITGLGSSLLLNKLNISNPGNGSYPESIYQKLSSLENSEKTNWDRLLSRVDLICKAAEINGIGVMIDAEESWIQDPIDLIADLMMEKYNKTKFTVFNTIQLYRSDRLSFLKSNIAQAIKLNYKPAYKLVRGAYMEKERKRAKILNYPSPIQNNKLQTDKAYNEAIDFCYSINSPVCIVIASHNEESTIIAAHHAEIESKKNVEIHFSQLYGMSDNLTFNLAANGFKVSKYLPFGPVEEVIPYLMRRAQENSSISGQTSRELYLLKKELSRRGKNH